MSRLRDGSARQPESLRHLRLRVPPRLSRQTAPDALGSNRDDHLVHPRFPARTVLDQRDHAMSIADGRISDFVHLRKKP